MAAAAAYSHRPDARAYLPTSLFALFDAAGATLLPPGGATLFLRFSGARIIFRSGFSPLGPLGTAEAWRLARRLAVEGCRMAKV